MSTGEMSEEEREKRKKLYGTAGEGLRPLNPYLWDIAEYRLLEIPVTTFPVIRTPFHMSYLLYLGTYSHALAKTYLRSALALCRVRGVQPSILLHPLDFLGGDVVKELAFFPGMKISTSQKLERFNELMEIILEQYQPLTMREHAERALGDGALQSRPL
jgi:hypothetical protein